MLLKLVFFFANTANIKEYCILFESIEWSITISPVSGLGSRLKRYRKTQRLFFSKLNEHGESVPSFVLAEEIPGNGNSNLKLLFVNLMSVIFTVFSRFIF